MKLTTVNWKTLAIVAGLTLSVGLTACSTTPSTPDATKQGDAMKGDAMKSDGKGDAMKNDGKGDAMKGDGKGDAMKNDGKGDAMKSNEKKTPTTKP